MTESESGGAHTADPQTQTTPVRPDAAQTRPWWKRPAGAAAASIFVALIAVAGYFGGNALLSPSSRQTASQSTPSTNEHVPRYLPPGAEPCPQTDTDVPGRFNAGARGTPVTSCGFVEQVRKAYSAQWPPPSGPGPLRVLSPATEKWYDLACLDLGNYVTCTGGAAAVIYLYHS